MEQFLPVEETETHIFLKKVMEKPADLAAHVRRCVHLPSHYQIVLIQMKPTGRLELLFFRSHTVMNCEEMTMHSST
jgi:hypothetical protein